MKNKQRKAIIAALTLIEKDMEKDITELTTKPFNGETVAVMFGQQAAAITALASLLKITLEKRGN